MLRKQQKTGEKKKSLTDDQQPNPLFMQVQQKRCTAPVLFLLLTLDSQRIRSPDPQPEAQEQS